MESFILLSIAEAAIASAGLPAEASAQAGGIGALGLDVRALLFQVLNFAILLALLRAFAYKPIVAILEERRRTIAESLNNAATIAATKAKLDQDRQAVVAAARREAAQLVTQGEEQATAIVAAAEAEAGERAKELITQAEARIESEVAAARHGLRAEAVALVATATEKIIDAKLDLKKDQELIRAAVQEAGQH